MSDFFQKGELVRLGSTFSTTDVMLNESPDAFAGPAGVLFRRSDVGIVVETHKSSVLWVEVLCPTGMGWVVAPYLEKITLFDG